MKNILWYIWKNICKEVSCNINKDIIEHFNNAVNYYFSQLTNKFKEKYPHLIEIFKELIQESLIYLSSKFNTEYTNLKTEIEQKSIEEWKGNAFKEIEKFMEKLTGQAEISKFYKIRKSLSQIRKDYEDYFVSQLGKYKEINIINLCQNVKDIQSFIDNNKYDDILKLLKHDIDELMKKTISDLRYKGLKFLGKTVGVGIVVGAATLGAGYAYLGAAAFAEVAATAGTITAADYVVGVTRRYYPPYPLGRGG